MNDNTQGGKSAKLKKVDCCATCQNFRGWFDNGWCALLAESDMEDCSVADLCFVHCYNICDKFRRVVPAEVIV